MMPAESRAVHLLTSASAMVVGEIADSPAAADEFFNGDQGLISVWDFDYDVIIDFESKFKCAQLAFVPPFCLVSSLCCYPCFMKKNVEWATKAKHLALTVDGIRYVQEKHPTCCGFSCTDRGKESKTVPYDKITDCDVQEPAGTACCCCIPNVLTKVHVDTASSGGRNKDGVQTHELSLVGLKHANDFKQAVWSMKRGELPANSSVPLGTGGRVLSAPAQAQMGTAILTEIRDELRELNSHLRGQK